MNNQTYQPIIGMEIHIELATESKMFCGCKNDPFRAEKPNIYTCPVCLGLPGGLPVPNKKAIEWTVKLGLALGCSVSELSKFDRKNYFYPDLAKGYQISQYDVPFCKNGIVHMPEGDVRIQRIHLEEDTGKLLHQTIDTKKITLIDFNRSGVPLVEIVTEPDIHSGQQAKAFLKRLHQIIKYLEISLADMEKGSMRLEPNISVKKQKADNKKQKDNLTAGEAGKDGTVSRCQIDGLPPYKVEVKNINSFNFVKKAIDFEIIRQTKILESGALPVQETRGYDEHNGSTFSQRLKEEAMDYRYFPDPDIPPIRLSKKEIEEIKNTIPELPDEKERRFIREYKISKEDAERICETKSKAQYFEQCISLSEADKKYSTVSRKQIVNVVLNKKEGQDIYTPEQLLERIVKTLADQTVDMRVLHSAVQKVIENQKKAVVEYSAGKKTVMMFLVGQVKRELLGKGDAKIIEQKIKELIL